MSSEFLRPAQTPEPTLYLAAVTIHARLDDLYGHRSNGPDRRPVPWIAGRGK